MTLSSSYQKYSYRINDTSVVWPLALENGSSDFSMSNNTLPATSCSLALHTVHSARPVGLDIDGILRCTIILFILGVLAVRSVRASEGSSSTRGLLRASSIRPIVTVHSSVIAG